MEFESPDVEREFPGLYASESAKRSNESDFSDESHERISRKELLIGKRKEKKDKKDRGYATLEGESSPEEESEIKSPSKVKKSKPFKFPSKKEKREKSRDKDTKDKESDKDKKKDEKEKEKKKDMKLKLKSKEKKKDKDKKLAEEALEFTEDRPIFGVPLSVAVERSKCHDGVDIPLIVRNCIDHVQETGLMAENVYNMSGIKSRVQLVRKMYNNHESVSLVDFDLPVSTSLLKQFLREMPEPVLTTELVSKFEEAGAQKDAASRVNRLRELVELLPSCNRALLGWLLKHFQEVTNHEKYNKMNVQAISVTMSPLLQISSRLLATLLCHVSELYPNLQLTKYVPPLSSTSPVLPDTTEGLALELYKQESLLSQIHREMNQGLTGKDREEQLWGVQRIITQLKRKLRALERSSGQRSLDDTDSSLRLDDSSLKKFDDKKIDDSPWTSLESHTLQEPNSRKGSGSDLSPWAPIDDSIGQSGGGSRRGTLEEVSHQGVFTPSSGRDTPSPAPLARPVMTAESLEVQDINREVTERAEQKQRALLETEELMTEITRLKLALEEERNQVTKIRTKIQALGGIPHSWCNLSDSSDDEAPPHLLEQNGLWKHKLELKEETKRLQLKKKKLIESILAESDACIDLRVQIKLLQMTKN